MWPRNHTTTGAVTFNPHSPLGDFTAVQQVIASGLGSSVQVQENRQSAHPHSAMALGGTAIFQDNCFAQPPGQLQGGPRNSEDVSALLSQLLQAATNTQQHVAATQPARPQTASAFQLPSALSQLSNLLHREQNSASQSAISALSTLQALSSQQQQPQLWGNQLVQPSNAVHQPLPESTLPTLALPGSAPAPQRQDLGVELMALLPHLKDITAHLQEVQRQPSQQQESSATTTDMRKGLHNWPSFNMSGHEMDGGRLCNTSSQREGSASQFAVPSQVAGGAVVSKDGNAPSSQLDNLVFVRELRTCRDCGQKFPWLKALERCSTCYQRLYKRRRRLLAQQSSGSSPPKPTGSEQSPDIEGPHRTSTDSTCHEMVSGKTHAHGSDTTRLPNDDRMDSPVRRSSLDGGLASLRKPQDDDPETTIVSGADQQGAMASKGEKEGSAEEQEAAGVEGGAEGESGAPTAAVLNEPLGSASSFFGLKRESLVEEGAVGPDHAADEQVQLEDEATTEKVRMLTEIAEALHHHQQQALDQQLTAVGVLAVIADYLGIPENVRETHVARASESVGKLTASSLGALPRAHAQSLEALRSFSASSNLLLPPLPAEGATRGAGNVAGPNKGGFDAANWMQQPGVCNPEIAKSKPSKSRRLQHIELLLNFGLLSEGQTVIYKSKTNRPMAKGTIREGGIECHRCGRVMGATDFELCAGSSLRRPFENIYTENGANLQELFSRAVCAAKTTSSAPSTLLREEPSPAMNTNTPSQPMTQFQLGSHPNAHGGHSDTTTEACRLLEMLLTTGSMLNTRKRKPDFP